MKSLEKIGENTLRFLAILLATILCATDLYYTDFNTGGILYQSLFILSLWIPSRQNNLMLAGLCTMYIALGYWWRHGTFIESYDLFSRSISVFGIWSITVVAQWRSKYQEAISGTERKIQALIAERTFDDREQFNKKNQALQMQLTQMKEQLADLLLADQEHRRMREAAELKAQTKTAFLNTMSEDVQRPIQNILEAAHRLADSPLDVEQRGYLFSIRSTGESVLSIAQDAQDFSKIEAGQLEVEHSSFIFRQTIEDAFDSVVNRATEKSIELSYNLDPSIPATLVSDGRRIRQVLANLLSHCVDRTQSGDITLSAKLLEKNSDGLMVYLAIKDNGPLLSQELISELFKPNDASTDAVPNHSQNLGLSICEKLCGLLGGKIWVESDGEKGTVFQVVIPAQKAATQDIPLQGKPWFIGKHVLIVEENVHVRRFLNHQLKNWGMQTSVFASGPEAIRWYAAGHVCDLALIDLDMPVLDGLTLSHQFRQNNKDLPIVLMTPLGSHVSDPVLSATIVKPIKQQRLYDQINAILSLTSTTEAEYVEIKEKVIR